MPRISANDLKTKGISAIEFALSTSPEAIVSVRGKDKFVVTDMAQYHYLRECELDAALAQTRADLLHSVSINLSYRITQELLIQDGQIIPVNVGDHDAVY